MKNGKEIIYDLYDLGMDPPHLNIEYDRKTVSEIRKFRETQTLLEWKGNKGETIKNVTGGMNETDANLTLRISNGNVLVFSSSSALTKDLLVAYINEETYDIDTGNKKHKKIGDFDISYMVITDEINASIQKQGTMILGLLKAYSKRSSFQKNG